MKDYLIHWWKGDVGDYYHVFSLTIAQANKLAKVGLYLIGLLALFEIVKFANVVGWLKRVSGISVAVVRFGQAVSSIPIIMVGVVAAFVGLTLGRLSPKQAALYPLTYVLSEAERVAQHESKNHFLVRYLGWLEQQPITERVIKTVAFFLLVVFAFIELLTS